jgi:HD-GYP domain-containing protein (c-di-GMP phosphodiesterase class II)
LSLISEFQLQVNQYKYLNKEGTEIFCQALDQCRKQQSTRFDPKLIDTLTLLVMGLQQGLDLPLMTTKVSSGLWLLDSRWDSQSKISEQISTYPQ